MTNKKLLLPLISLLIVAGPSLAQACNWVRVGEFEQRLECRSNYKEFFGKNSQALNKLLMEAAYYAVGEAQKLSAENWAIRNAITVEDGAKLLENRFEAEKIMNAMNAQIRQLESLNGGRTLGDNTIPSAIMLGVTKPLNGDITRLPLGSVFSKLAPNPGGSLFVGWVIVPQKVQFMMNEYGEIVGPEEYTSQEPKLDPNSYSGKLNSLLTPATEGSQLDYALGRIRLDMRFVVIPSVDFKTGKEGAFKSTSLQPTVGFVFSKDLVKSHQILNYGPAGSIPGHYVRGLKNTPVIGQYIPNWLLAPVEKYVDTIKVASSFSAQMPTKEASLSETIQFAENVFMWLRLKTRKQLAQPVDPVTSAVEGKFRAGAFWVLSPSNDGESESYSNGLDFDGITSIGSSIFATLSEILTSDEEVSDEEKTLEFKIQTIEQSLQDEDLDSETRNKVEQELQRLKNQKQQLQQ